MVNTPTSPALLGSVYLDKMGRYNDSIKMMGLLMLLLWAKSVSAFIDCGTVTSLISACSTFITYGTPDPLPASPCCDALTGLTNIAASTDDRRSVCRCFLSLITTYNPNATALATLPGFCGVSLGFTVLPNTDCN